MPEIDIEMPSLTSKEELVVKVVSTVAGFYATKYAKDIVTQIIIARKS